MVAPGWRDAHDTLMRTEVAVGKAGTGIEDENSRTWSGFPDLVNVHPFMVLGVSDPLIAEFCGILPLFERS
jgi:hypothetical protein